MPLTDIHKEKIRSAMKGRFKGIPKSPEHRRRIARKIQVREQSARWVVVQPTVKSVPSKSPKPPSRPVFPDGASVAHQRRCCPRNFADAMRRNLTHSQRPPSSRHRTCSDCFGGVCARRSGPWRARRCAQRSRRATAGRRSGAGCAGSWATTSARAR